MKTSFVLTCFLLAATPVVAQERIVVAGAGAHIRLMQALAAAYQMRHPSQQVRVNPENLGSTGGIRAAQAGGADIGLTSRPLRTAERGGLVYRVYGRTPLIVGVHADVQVGSLTESQLCDIFSGRITSWKDLGAADTRIVALTRNEDGTKTDFRAQIPCFKDLKETTEAIVLTKASAMAQALSTRPSTIGLTDLMALTDARHAFTAVRIDGVAPSLEALGRGQYRLFKPLGVVTLGEPQGLAKGFLQFVAGSEAEPILARHGAAPAH